MEDLMEYLEMGGHGGYIWASYGMVLVVLLGLWMSSRRYIRSSQGELNQLTAEAPHRRQGRPNET